MCRTESLHVFVNVSSLAYKNIHVYPYVGLRKLKSLVYFIFSTSNLAVIIKDVINVEVQ